jgi:hypothetical protein
MIRIKIIGGLGNQMFQYATAYAVARDIKEELVVDISHAIDYKVHPLRIVKLSCSAPFSDEKHFLDSLLFRPKLEPILRLLTDKYYIEQSLRYNSILDSGVKDKTLVGYFQSEKYFSHYRDDLLNEFKPQAPFSKKQRSLIKRIHSSSAVSMHVRRGDYVTSPEANQYHGVCNERYFMDALDRLKKLNLLNKGTIIFIFSDDIEWCKKNIKLELETVFVEGDEEHPELDMWIMSYCKHNIISNSSFSWWGAWLNNNLQKIVIAPKVWFANTSYDSKDILPITWISL